MTPASTNTKRKTRTGGKSATAGPLSAEELHKMDAYRRASNYLSVGQIYLLDNPLLREPLNRRGQCLEQRLSHVQGKTL